MRALVKKVVVKTVSGSNFGWKELGFQCGVWFNALPSHVILNLCSYLMRKDPPEVMEHPDEGVLPASSPTTQPLDEGPPSLDEPFLPSFCLIIPSM